MAFRSKNLSIMMVFVSFSVQLISVVDGETTRNRNKETQSSSVTNPRSLPDQPEPMWIGASLDHEYDLDQLLLSDGDVYLANRARFDHSSIITPEHEELLELELQIYYFIEMLIEDGGVTFCEQDGGEWIRFEPLSDHYSQGGNSAVPNIQKIANEELLVKPSYCGVPKCAPSRKSLLAMYRALYQAD